METVFSGNAPDGSIYTVFSDGSCEGFPDGTIVHNYFVRRYAHCQALLKKCVDAGAITDHEASSISAGWP